jgi:GTP cyclohydrolase IA
MISRESVANLLEEIDSGRGIINAEVFANTPDRVARMYNQELLRGYDIDPAEILATTFESDHREMVIITPIRFSSLCEHHMLPFRGVAHIGYLPDGGIVGLSKLVRLINDCYAPRLQLQERLASELADALMAYIKPRPLGAGVVIDAEHECMAIRGVRSPGARTRLSALRGRFQSDAKTQAEFLRLIALQ